MDPTQLLSRTIGFSYLWLNGIEWIHFISMSLKGRESRAFILPFIPFSSHCILKLNKSILSIVYPFQSITFTPMIIEFAFYWYWCATDDCKRNKTIYLAHNRLWKSSCPITQQRKLSNNSDNPLRKHEENIACQQRKLRMNGYSNQKDFRGDKVRKENSLKSSHARIPISSR